MKFGGFFQIYDLVLTSISKENISYISCRVKSREIQGYAHKKIVNGGVKMKDESLI